MPARIEGETPLEKLARIREKTKLRARRYYGKHRQEVLDKRKQDWKNLKEECNAQIALANRNRVYQEPLIAETPIVVEEPIIEPTRTSTRVSKRIAQLTTKPVYVAPELPRGRPTVNNQTLRNSNAVFSPTNIMAILKTLEKNAGTKKANIQSVGTLVQIANPILDKDWEQGLANADVICTKIEEARKLQTIEKYSTNSKLQFVKLILKIIDNVIPSLKDKKDIYTNYMNRLLLRLENEKKNTLVNVYRYDKLKEKILQEFGVDSKEYLLTSLYGEITVRDNFSELKIIKNRSELLKDGTTNYLIEPNPENKNYVIYLQNYKTKRLYHDLEFTCNQELNGLLKKYIDNNEVHIRTVLKNYLFGVSKLSGFIKTMLKKIGINNKGSSINYFRHSVALSKDGAGEQTEVNLAKDMGHSLLTHLQYKQHNLIE